jgi:hypothetical protein
LKQSKNKFESFKIIIFRKISHFLLSFLRNKYIKEEIESYTAFKSLDLPLIDEKGNYIDNIYDLIKYLKKMKHSKYKNC